MNKSILTKISATAGVLLMSGAFAMVGFASSNGQSPRTKMDTSANGVASTTATDDVMTADDGTADAPENNTAEKDRKRFGHRFQWGTTPATEGEVSMEFGEDGEPVFITVDENGETIISDCPEFGFRFGKGFMGGMNFEDAGDSGTWVKGEDGSITIYGEDGEEIFNFPQKADGFEFKSEFRGGKIITDSSDAEETA